MTERIKITISIVLPVIIQYAWSPIFISLVFFSSKLSSDTRISNDRLSTKFSISQESSFRTGYIYTHVHRLEATKKYVPRSINSFQPEVSVSIRWKELCVIHLRSRQLASIVEWRKDVSVGQKDWHRGIKLLCVTAEREYSIIIHVFSRSPLWIHTARDFIARRSSLNDELPIERHLWAKKKKKNQSLSRKGYAILFIKMRFFYKLWRKLKRISSNI